MKKLRCVLLIDDSESANFFNERIIRKSSDSDQLHILTAENGLHALELLMVPNSGSPRPDLIFLDINMPVMNGWEFIEKYRELDPSVTNGMVIYLLTTSLNPEDEAKAGETHEVAGLVNKPLTKDVIHAIREKHFSG